jgi:UDP-N-acetylmuramoyl-tripeptide--D-alanyl-D-alanine ligase
VINDAYNANPVSMAAALEAFAETPAAGKRWLVLGGMRELGAAEREEHARLGRLVAMGPWAGLVAVGALGRLIADAAGDAAGFAGEVVRVGGPREAADALAERLGPGDTMLLKASRAERLEDLLNPLAARLKAGGSGGGDRTGERH